MRRNMNWCSAGRYVPAIGPLYGQATPDAARAADGFVQPTSGQGAAQVEAELARIARACREIAFCELSEALAQARIRALRGVVAGCRAEAEARRQETPEDADLMTAEAQVDLRFARETLEEELSSFEETLPLEAAFRADQRDRATASILTAQERLQQALQRAGAECPDPVALGARPRILAAVALTPAEVIANARERARDRMAAEEPAFRSPQGRSPPGWPQ